jgi:hypothetical protein
VERAVACQFRRGTNAEWRQNVLKPGFDAIKRTRPDALVGAPGVDVNSGTDLDSWW